MGQGGDTQSRVKPRPLCGRGASQDREEPARAACRHKQNLESLEGPCKLIGGPSRRRAPTLRPFGLPPSLSLRPMSCAWSWRASICDLDDARRGQQMAITECGWSRSGRWVVSARCAPQRGTELVVCPSGTKRLDRARRRRPGTARRDGKITITGRGWGCWGQRIASARPVPGPSSPIRMLSHGQCNRVAAIGVSGWRRILDGVALCQ